MDLRDAESALPAFDDPLYRWVVSIDRKTERWYEQEKTDCLTDGKRRPASKKYKNRRGTCGGEVNGFVAATVFRCACGDRSPIQSLVFSV